MSTLSDWAELLRIPALCSVPGDAVAGAAASRLPLGAGTVLAAGASACLYEAGMALNDWADRKEDTAERPHRPIPSGRIAPAHALMAATGLTAAGLGLAYAAGRPAALCATALAGLVWAYDLRLKHTPVGAAAMAATRATDLLLGAAATARGASAGDTARALRHAMLPAAALGAHTYAVTMVSRVETRGGSPARPLAALGATVVLGALIGTLPRPDRRSVGRADGPDAPARSPGDHVRTALAGAYVATAARPYLHAALNPSPPLTQKAVAAGIRALIPLQAALAARYGAPVAAVWLSGLGPLACRLSRKVSPT